QVVRFGDVSYLVDTDKVTKGGVTVQLGQAVVEPDMAAQDTEHEHAPEHANRVVVTAVAARLLQAVEEVLVRQGGEDGTDGLQGGGVLQTGPGEQRLGGVDEHGKAPQARARAIATDPPLQQALVEKSSKVGKVGPGSQKTPCCLGEARFWPRRNL